MRYFCFLGLLAMIACGGDKDRSSPADTGFVMPSEETGAYSADATSNGSQDYGQPANGTQSTEQPAQGGASVAPVKEEPPKLTQTQTQRPRETGYAPSCCMVQYKADIKLAPLSGQESQAACYALDDICNVYPTQCIAVTCPAGTFVQ